MKKKNIIPVEEYCSHYNIETTFIRSLDNHGLIELRQAEGTYHIDYSQLTVLEKYTHLYYDLEINLEGIEAISHLLERINNLQTELRVLKNRFPRFE
jgi:hypothetical protein